jgi:hypothetical protein
MGDALINVVDRSYRFQQKRVRSILSEVNGNHRKPPCFMQLYFGEKVGYALSRERAGQS